MAVFWFGLGKKIKNVFTKKEADQLYLSKTDNNLQIVQGAVDFYGNIVAKRNGYVDYVDTNTPTSMINKQYLEDNYVPLNQGPGYVEIKRGPYTNLATFVANVPNKYNHIVITYTRLSSANHNLGKFNYRFYLDKSATKSFIGSNMYYSTTSNYMEQGALVGLMINVVPGTDTQDINFTVQIFDNSTDKIGQVKIRGGL